MTLHTIPEATAFLRLSRSSLYRLIREGRLRPVKNRGRTMFTQRELDAYVASLVRAA